MNIEKQQRFPFGDDKILDPKITRMCPPSSRDPTKIYQRTLPTQYYSQALPTDPRPWTRICMEYVNSGPAEMAPTPSFIPVGAQISNPIPYLENINEESSLERLGRPLQKDLPQSCNPRQYLPALSSDMYQQQTLIPRPTIAPNRIMKGLESPEVLRQTGQYDCSSQAMMCDAAANGLYWNNSTKQQKFNQKQGQCGVLNGYAPGGKYPNSKNPIPL